MSNSTPYQPPEYKRSSFNCPHCGAYARIHWGEARSIWPNGRSDAVEWADFASCSHCDRWLVWYEEQMIHPEATLTEKPNEDLPDEVKKDYLEAASILQKSPRGAAALLRLAIQKLCDSLDTSNKDLNGKIATLVSKGLDVKIQKALDIVRVIGNEAVHPGQIDLNDTPEIAHQLFKLVNLVAQRMISDPSELDEIYSKLPVEQLDAIKKRDQNSRPK